MDHTIEISGLTKDYGDSRGLFDVDLTVEPGQVFGLVGINGSGKSTMIRHLMGFLHPQSGRCSIQGMDCWRRAAELKRSIGYVPGEIAFPDVKTGFDFFNLQAGYFGKRDQSRLHDLIDRFRLDASAPLKRMSKGMKQKTAIVAAFMTTAPILILDEGTTGLDPLMQKVFTDLVREEKANGRTMFMSSHMFDELEASCDRVAFLKRGRVIEVVDMSQFNGDEPVKEYKIEFNQPQDYLAFLSRPFSVSRRQEHLNQVSVQVADLAVADLFAALADLDVRFITQVPRTLARHFIQKYYETEGHPHV
ncbi:MAG: ATP-binding cassette domain-containing protein [Propionibacteriaceae bacterium]|jgi:ABC-2 type transport system ATP-binding protein|nr:ATP-binding cassette domain-containing protein [Propionibacteriaceae bacterium]